MFLKFLKEDSLIELKEAVPNNLELYKQNNSWITNFFQEKSWYFQTKVKIDEINLLDGKKDDLKNTITLFSALKYLTITDATDERFWSYLTHVTFWKYMRSRWPVEEKLKGDKPADVVIDRYFFKAKTDRALIRNGIARLWWFGYVSYDENRDDPFELTKVLLLTQDIAENLLGRAFARNPKIIKPVLNAMLKMDAGSLKREVVREFSRRFRWLGGVTILDALDENEIEEIVVSEIIRANKKYSISNVIKEKASQVIDKITRQYS